MKSSAAFALMATPASAENYCPQAGDMFGEFGDVQFTNGGWVMTGSGRVSSKTAWNLLGGSMEFDMDTSGTNPEVNVNFYTVSPDKPNCGQSCYCDIQGGGHPSCMEMDIIEANGNCRMQTTIHTFAQNGSPGNRNCDRWGCQSQLGINGKYHIKAVFGEDGSMTVYKDGVPNNNYSPQPSDASNDVVRRTMQSIGAVIESSQWFGWAPASGSCPGGGPEGLGSSRFSISNVRVVGTVVQGPEPTKCGGPAPQPHPSPSPAPSPRPPSPPSPPSPAGGCCSWDNEHCGRTTDFCKASDTNCENFCHGRWIHPSGSSPAPVPPSGCCSWDHAMCGSTTDYCENQANCEQHCKGEWIYPSSSQMTNISNIIV